MPYFVSRCSEMMCLLVDENLPELIARQSSWFLTFALLIVIPVLEPTSVWLLALRIMIR